MKKTAQLKKVQEQEIQFFRCTGRRKQAIALVRLTQGSGTIVVNEKDYKVYFPLFALQKSIESPLVITDTRGSFDVSVKVFGGGVRGQAEAVRHGIARCLLLKNSEWRKTLRSQGFLTRDSRVKERKKPGLKRARRAPQWQKR